MLACGVSTSEFTITGYTCPELTESTTDQISTTNHSLDIIMGWARCVESLCASRSPAGLLGEAIGIFMPISGTRHDKSGKINIFSKLTMRCMHAGDHKVDLCEGIRCLIAEP